MGVRNNGMFPVRELIDRIPPEWRKVREFQEICSSGDSAIETLRNAVKSTLEQQFVMTATDDGLSRFERVFGILPKATDTLQDRRFRVLTYMMTDIPYTEKNIKAALEKLCGDGNVSISVNTSTYTVTVRIGLSAREAYSDTEKMLDKILPCNMVLDLSPLYNWHDMFTTYTHDQLSTYTHSQLREYENFGGE